MTSDEWQAIKVCDRLRADAEWHADPQIAQAFYAAWGRDKDVPLDMVGSIPLADGDLPHWQEGEDPRPVEFD